ncbi:MAG: bifunctional adenosylcobinamide kinase/adenosylcobinamide-phosphate guanylyltransferase [Desulfobacteraceae bacterium]|nr:MAG: bifunctional adenosylcobinamide kinase/adenosylcobinamide-phosphate guanylyltransferase [Desulfobacteraceae bacterium]
MSEFPSPPARLTFITGASRSGKTRLALKIALGCPEPRGYLATAQALDGEMALRIRRHQEEREGNFETIEEPLQLTQALTSIGKPFTIVIIDCLTLWLSNLMAKWGEDEDSLRQETARVVDFFKSFRIPTVIIANEVGWGIVPDNPLARNFRDLSGNLNQALAAVADQVILTVAGIPLFLKQPPSGKP